MAGAVRNATPVVLYRDAAGHAISFYVRPPGPRRHLLSRGERVDGGLLAQYGSGNGYNYAVVSRAGGDDAQVAARALQPLIRRQEAAPTPRRPPPVPRPPPRRHKTRR